MFVIVSGDVTCHTFLKILLLGGGRGKDVVGTWP